MGVFNVGRDFSYRLVCAVKHDLRLDNSGWQRLLPELHDGRRVGKTRDCLYAQDFT